METLSNLAQGGGGEEFREGRTSWNYFKRYLTSMKGGGLFQYTVISTDQRGDSSL